MTKREREWERGVESGGGSLPYGLFNKNLFQETCRDVGMAVVNKVHKQVKIIYSQYPTPSHINGSIIQAWLAEISTAATSLYMYRDG